MEMMAAMNNTYGFGSCRNAIFQPLVNYAFYSGAGITNPTPLFRLLRRFSEFICYAVGRIVHRNNLGA
jgi:hypothetical protein